MAMLADDWLEDLAGPSAAVVGGGPQDACAELGALLPFSSSTRWGGGAAAASRGCVAAGWGGRGPGRAPRPARPRPRLATPSRTACRSVLTLEDFDRLEGVSSFLDLPAEDAWTGQLGADVRTTALGGPEHSPGRSFLAHPAPPQEPAADVDRVRQQPLGAAVVHRGRAARPASMRQRGAPLRAQAAPLLGPKLEELPGFVPCLDSVSALAVQPLDSGASALTGGAAPASSTGATSRAVLSSFRPGTPSRRASLSSPFVVPAKKSSRKRRAATPVEEEEEDADPEDLQLAAYALLQNEVRCGGAAGLARLGAAHQSAGGA